MSGRPLREYIAARIQAHTWTEQGTQVGADGAPGSRALWLGWLDDTVGQVDIGSRALVIQILDEALELATLLAPSDPVAFAEDIMQADDGGEQPDRHLPIIEAAVDMLVARIHGEDVMMGLAAERWIDVCREAGAGTTGQALMQLIERIVVAAARAPGAERALAIYRSAD